MLQRLIPVLLGAAVLTSPLSAITAQTEPAAKSAPASVEAGSYAVDPAHTRVLFSVSHMGFTEVTTRPHS